MRRLALAMIAPLLSLGACSLVLSLDDLHPSGSALPDAGVAYDCAMSDAACAVPRIGPPMVRVGCFCIDPYEARAADYAAFQDAAVSADALPLRPAGCEGKTPATLAPTTAGDPVHGIDWCDAYLYCAWSGRHLCGRLGGGNVTNLAPDPSELTYACSRGGAREYPYGDAFLPGACSDQTAGTTIRTPGALKTCEGGFPGLFDMVGNLGEWENGCDEPGNPKSLCRIRGGHVWMKLDKQLSCSTVVNARRDSKEYYAGIRCCAGP